MIVTATKQAEKTAKLETCYHCGEANGGEILLYDNKAFCCNGCQLVYSILKENDLGQYYAIEKQAGASQRNKKVEKFAFLDDEKTIAQLISFREGSITKVRFNCPQIHCASCLWLLENLPRLQESIQQSRVDFLKKEVQITFDISQISLRDLVELLNSIGYAPTLHLQNLNESLPTKKDHSLSYQLGLAGFVFGNVMLLSFPEYLGLDLLVDAYFARFLGYLNILLALPLVFYSGKRYLQSAWQSLKQKHLNIDVPVSIGILALFFRSMYEILSHTGAGYLDSLAGLIFFLLIGQWFQQKTYAKIAFDRDYKSYFPIACLVRRKELEKNITLNEVEPGDVLLIRHGELIPADGILIKGEASIDYSFVSGESALVEKKVNEQLFAGGRQQGGLIEILVNKNIKNSYLTSLWNNDTFSKTKALSGVSVLADKVANWFTWGILLVAFLTLFYWLPKDVGIAINAFTAVLIVACPCAVALSIPFAFGNILRVFARNNIFLKNSSVIEKMANINQVVFDKTGTITANTAVQKMTYIGEPLTKKEQQQIRSLASHSSHPLSRQIFQHFPVSSILSVISFKEEKGKGITGTIAETELKIGSQNFTGSEETKKGSVFIMINGKVKGFFNNQITYQKNLSNVLNKIKAWAEISLLSGDNDKERQALLPYFKKEKVLHFNASPADKLQFVERLQAKGKTVAMIGDGLNDAGALSQSNVGVVITENTSNFTPACDVILSAKQFDQLPLLFELAKKSIWIVYGAYFLALCYNVVGLSFAIRGALSPAIAAILMPLSSISVVVFSVLIGNYIAYKKGLEIIEQ